MPTKILATVLAIATVALVGTAILQHEDTIDAITVTNRLAKATEDNAVQSRAMGQPPIHHLKQCFDFILTTELISSQFTLRPKSQRSRAIWK